MLKLGQEAWVRWTRAARRCAQGAFRSLRRRESKQAHRTDLALVSPGISVSSPASGGGIWVWSWNGSHYSLWRSRFPLSNFQSQVERGFGELLNIFLDFDFWGEMVKTEAADFSSFFNVFSSVFIFIFLGGEISVFRLIIWVIVEFILTWGTREEI